MPSPSLFSIKVVDILQNLFERLYGEIFIFWQKETIETVLDNVDERAFARLAIDFVRL